MTDMEIETFLTVLRSGSMTAAAQALYITQPTLSARLQTLEDDCLLYTSPSPRDS